MSAEAGLSRLKSLESAVRIYHHPAVAAGQFAIRQVPRPVPALIAPQRLEFTYHETDGITAD